MATTTLRELNGLDRTPATLSGSTLILVDYQNTYTRGVLELTGWRPALTAAENLLEAARAAGSAIIHVVHDGGAGSLYDVREEIGAIHPDVAPAEGEPVVVKGAPNAFVGTDLGERVDAAGNETVVVAGFMTNMCVTFTTEGAFLRGNHATVVADACATRPLETPVAAVTAEQLHHSALATIADLYGVVVAGVAGLRG
ncbi:Nicotinamidase-related amidase [Amycolatopsis pretoriensis]|uniref:Nicotinamidase-related amidase n=1 Tax=Amycolatopsis pretoriensis TaxID=218821 RepID=A0A1H5R3L7_9PSEU|nr:cysteine hydrolase family protein [Amycolatopsis pretoriensis]SEF32634.1 Nicotinamidase-related amidase [Amycolatopsis pretoriensis]